MTAIRRQQREIERLESMPAVFPPSLAEAFEAVENLDAKHPTSRGQTFAGIIAVTGRGFRGRR